MKGDLFQSELQTKFGKCICTSCSKRGCELGLGSLLSHCLIVIDADKYQKCCNFKGRICDYILFYLKAKLVVSALELKSGLIKARVAQKQIEKGSKVAEQITESRRVSNFYPILLYGRRIHYLEIKTLRSAKVCFQNKSYMIILEPCGTRLSEIIRRYPAS